MSELPCSKCHQPGKFYCERCLEPYCSSDCQIGDWQVHKSRCFKIPNLIPMQILKSATSNLSLKSETSFRKSHGGSKENINDTRRSSNNSVVFGGSKARNPVECGESCTGAKPKKLLQDGDFTLVSKTATSTPIPASIDVTPTTAPVSNISCTNVNTIAAEKPPNWRIPFAPPANGYFEVIIQFVEEAEQANKRFLWVTDVKYDGPLRKLLAEINRNINQQEPCKSELIFPGALVAAPLGKILYRAEVLDCCAESQKADVRLIDYGNEMRIPYNQIFAPIPIMANLNAYAFRVCLRGDCGPLQLESVLTIKVVGSKHSEGYYNVECKEKSIPMELPVELLTKEKSLTVVKYFVDGRHALLRLSAIEGLASLDDVLNSEQTIQYEFDKVPSEGTFVAARTKNGWKRARLLAYWEKGHEFLVYTIDDGFITRSPQIKRIPTAFLNHPMQVFAVSTSSTDYMLSETMLASVKKLSIQLLPATSVTAGKDSKTHLSCALFEDSRKIVDVVIASVFTGCVDELDIDLWYDLPGPGSFVTVSHVITFKEVCIAALENKDYDKIFESEHSKCLPFENAAPGELKTGVVVFVSDQQGHKYRGQVINCENNMYRVKNVDKGGESSVDRKCLHKPTNLIRYLPVRCSLIKLMYLSTVPTPIAYNKALTSLEKCMENSAEFEVYVDKENNGVDLLFRTKERQSLCKKLLPLVFDAAEVPASTPTGNTVIPSQPEVPARVVVTEKSPPPPTSTLTPPNTPVTVEAPPIPSAAVNSPKIFTLDDLEIIPIQCGENAELFTLDATSIMNLDGPYITAADFTNKSYLRKLETDLVKVAEYCKSSKAPKGGYAPQKMELCLSVFAVDGQWYRAMCIDSQNDNFLVLFLDYGNLSKVNKKDIMPMVPELMFPANANMVYIEGIKTKEQALKFAKSLEASPIIKAHVSQIPDSDAYLAKVRDLEKIIA
ncbi:kotsubu [Musca autumnalis]|uniref:kotsubu n=1 Tax=Musca autumnalis TaxID=221902 RepID=UPI003CF468C0